MIKTIVIIFKICFYSSSRKIQLQQVNVDDYVWAILQMRHEMNLVWESFYNMNI